MTAIDSVAVTIILDFGGDRKRALRELSERFGLAKTDQRRRLAKKIGALIRANATQAAIEAVALVEGERLGLTRTEVFDVARWIAAQPARTAA